jgi:hypothetical protein
MSLVSVSHSSFDTQMSLLLRPLQSEASAPDTRLGVRMEIVAYGFLEFSLDLLALIILVIKKREMTKMVSSSLFLTDRGKGLLELFFLNSPAVSRSFGLLYPDEDLFGAAWQHNVPPAQTE